MEVELHPEVCFVERADDKNPNVRVLLRFGGPRGLLCHELRRL